MSDPETLRRAAKAIDDYEGCARMYDRKTEELYDLYELADAWAADKKRLEAAERAAVEFAAMLAHQAGGEFRLTPVLLRGDERVVVWDDPLTGERIFRLVPNDPNRPPGATEEVEGGVQGG